jgi:hypothetical protein
VRRLVKVVAGMVCMGTVTLRRAFVVDMTVVGCLLASGFMQGGGQGRGAMGDRQAAWHH